MKMSTVLVVLVGLALVGAQTSELGRVSTEGCGISTYCWASPPRCALNRVGGPPCDYLVKFYRNGAGNRFILQTAKLPEKVAHDSNYYVSVGFSKTPSMEESLIVACIYDWESTEQNTVVRGTYAKWKKAPKRRVSRLSLRTVHCFGSRTRRRDGKFGEKFVAVTRTSITIV